MACKCGGLIRDDTCDRCGPRRTYGAHKLSSTQRGYDSQWQKVRARVLRDHPLCQDCENAGIVAVATEVHHVIKIKHAPEKRLDEANLMALCRTCHAKRTAGGE